MRRPMRARILTNFRANCCFFFMFLDVTGYEDGFAESVDDVLIVRHF
jgi:hypothetical protein